MATLVGDALEGHRYIDLIGEVLQKGQVRSYSQPACVYDQMNESGRGERSM